MLKKVIAGWTAAPGAPMNWDPARDGQCDALPVRVLPHGGSFICESAWEFTPHELEMLNAGGQLVLRVYGGQPPVALYVEPAPAEEKPAPLQVPV